MLVCAADTLIAPPHGFLPLFKSLLGGDSAPDRSDVLIIRWERNLQGCEGRLGASSEKCMRFNSAGGLVPRAHSEECLFHFGHMDDLGIEQRTSEVRAVVDD